ncbi:NADPH Oxidase [Seminavis robusta]|uniref:NADPH Oxidase n=1 Tax=Seminavis robusta TaxID=568900 RepID=A0A9N8DGP9_9STRA|nr:NADPH Oxidase [Seminavis robusta]|eukprot:Sro136_g064110.1 NADPH Oxidase (338) ;mRNA; r:57919-59031
MARIRIPTFTDILEASMHVNLHHLRWLSFFFMSFSVTPLTSIYVVLSTIWGETHPTNNSNGVCSVMAAGASSNTCSIGNMMQQQIETDKSLSLICWNALLKGAAETDPGRHWTAAIAWFMSTLLGLVVPAILYLFSWIRTWRNERFKKEHYDLYCMKKRRRRWKHRLAQYTMTLREEDKVIGEPSEHAKTTIVVKPDNNPQKVAATSRSVDSWRIPPPGCMVDNTTTTTCTTTRTVYGLCAICLHNYEPSQSVVWSTNPQCCHSFHLDCLLDWFAARRRKQHSCPCCRQVFVVAAKKQPKKKPSSQPRLQQQQQQQQQVQVQQQQHQESFSSSTSAL